MSDDKMEIARARVGRLIEVLALVSMGDFDSERTKIHVEKEDDFGTLQESLNIFIGELAEARREGDAAMQKLLASRSELEDKLKTIDRQRATIQDLSTPVLELWDDIITLPVVGVIDSQRAVDMTEQLLSRIVAMKAKCVIIDLTGVDVVDTMTADHFIRMTNSARLLGAYCVITGIRPAIAQTLSEIGGVEHVRTLRSLKEGIRECLRYLRTGDARGALIAK